MVNDLIDYELIDEVQTHSVVWTLNTIQKRVSCFCFQIEIKLNDNRNDLPYQMFTIPR